MNASIMRLCGWTRVRDGHALRFRQEDADVIAPIDRLKNYRTEAGRGRAIVRADKKLVAEFDGVLVEAVSFQRAGDEEFAALCWQLRVESLTPEQLAVMIAQPVAISWRFSEQPKPAIDEVPAPALRSHGRVNEHRPPSPSSKPCTVAEFLQHPRVKSQTRALIEMWRDGHSLRSIALELGIHRNSALRTIQRWSKIITDLPRLDPATSRAFAPSE